MRPTRPPTRGTGTNTGYTRGAQSSYQRSPAKSNYARTPAQGSYAPAATPLGIRNIPKPVINIGAMVLVVMIIVAIIIGIANNSKQADVFSTGITAGVKINGKDVSGQDVNKLSVDLKNTYQKQINNISVKITYNDKTWMLNGADIGAAANVDDVIGQISLLARTGTKEQRQADAKRIAAEGRNFTVALTLDPNKLKIKLNEIASQVSKPGRDASVMFIPDNTTFQPPTDKDAFKTYVPTQQDIDKMFIVNDEVAGQVVDVDAMMQKITDDLKDDWKADQALIVGPFVPNVTAESLKKSFHFLSIFRTPISSESTKERNHNIVLALSKFSGARLDPGQEISFNDTTGERSAANGYEKAHIINGDSYEDDYGGGVCQASTTLYNAALLAGCKITDRGHHSIPSDYVIKGFDAMVNTISKADLKFVNQSDGPMFIKAWVTPNNRYAYVMILGEPLTTCAKLAEDYHIDKTGPDPGWNTVVDNDGTYADKVPYADSKPYPTMKPHPELWVTAFLVYLDANGNEIKRDKLYQDHFGAVIGTQYIGKDARPGTSDSGATAAPGSDG